MDAIFWKQKSLEWVAHTREIMAQVLTRVGPRPSGSPQSRETASMLADAIRPFAHSVKLESFLFARHPFLAFLKWQAITFVLAVVGLFLDWILVSGLLILVGAVVTIAQFVLYREFLDPLYPKTEGVNMIASVEPDREVLRQVIFSGHHDSAFVFRFLQWQPRLYAIHLVLANLFIWMAIFTVPTWAGLSLFGITPFYSEVLPWIMTVGALFVAPLGVFVSRRCTPGAGDNLVASAGVVALAKALSQERALGSITLKNTRVIFASFDAEESGLRGARAYVKRHLADLKAVPTQVVNIDSIYELKDLRFVIRDINGTMPLSSRMGHQCVELARSLGFASSVIKMPLGSGATDAGEFGRVGIPATTMIAMSSTPIPPKGFPYHTLRDTMDVVKPEAVAAMLEVMWGMLLMQEEGGEAPTAGA